MDFFARQEKARRNTGWLVVLFAGAVIGTIASIYIAIAAAVSIQNQSELVEAEGPLLFWNPELLIGTSGLVSLIVLIGTAYKLHQLRQGGTKVAEMLGGYHVPPQSQDRHERRLLNVVEEMAIASGVPVPPVYVMRGQAGINAFAAGYSMNDAVVGVTEGAMRGLRRDELQGVVAHEFSHILNGDMRLNIRLIGIVHGLLALAIMGRVLLRVAASSRPRSGKKDNGAALFLAAGLLFMIVGYVGYFFGGLIKRAVSRQREYLADASAVQFTRNPTGLANALKKVAGFVGRGRVDHAHAEELSHMFFADGLKRMFAGGLFATHPPIAERIRLLDPDFKGEVESLSTAQLLADGNADDGPSAGLAASTRTAPPPLPPEALLEQAGHLSPESVSFAAELLELLPADLRDAARDPESVYDLLLALVAHGHDLGRHAAPDSTAAFIARHAASLEGLDSRQRLALVDLAMPAARQLTAPIAQDLLGHMRGLAAGDGSITLFEMAIVEMTKVGLRETLGERPPRVRGTRLQDVAGEVASLLLLMAYVGSADRSKAQSAYERGLARVLLPQAEHPYREPDAELLGSIEGALARLRSVTMPVRRDILAALLTTLMHDQHIESGERELFRAVAASLEVPVPPAVA